MKKQKRARQGKPEGVELHKAVWAGDAAALRELLEAGADPNAPDEYGYPALHGALRDRKMECAELLWKAGASVDAMVQGAPLISSMLWDSEERLEQVNWLIERGAKVGAHGSGGPRPIHYAAMFGQWAALEALINAGAGMESKTREGMTALHFAVRDGHEAVCALLLSRGASPEARDKDGRDALGWGRARGHGWVDGLVSYWAQARAAAAEGKEIEECVARPAARAKRRPL